MNRLQRTNILSVLLVAMVSIVGCRPIEKSPTPIVFVPSQYVLMTPREARTRAEDKLSALDDTTRNFLKDFLGDLVPGDEVISGVKINGVDDVIIGVTSQLLTITDANGEYAGTIYCMFINTVDLEIVGGGSSYIVKKGLYAWGVGPKKLSLTAMTEPGSVEMIFDQPFADFTEITADFVPRMSTTDQGFVITIAGKPISFRQLDEQTSATPVTQDATLPFTSNPSSTNQTWGASPPFDKATYPFEVGNLWTYSKTVNSGHNIQFWVKLNTTDGGTAEMLLEDNTCEPGTYTEAFSVVNQIDDHSWEMKVTGSSDKCLGRYRDASQIVWSVEPHSSPPHYGRVIIEQITYDEWSQYWPINSAGDNLVAPYIHTQPLIYVMSGPENSLYQNNYAIAYIFYPTASSPEEFPIGTFDRCTAIRDFFSTDIPSQGDKPDISELVNGYQEINSYCWGIGFTRFVQKDLADNPVYTMELLEYHLASQH